MTVCECLASRLLYHRCTLAAFLLRSIHPGQVPPPVRYSDGTRYMLDRIVWSRPPVRGHSLWRHRGCSVEIYTFFEILVVEKKKERQEGQNDQLPYFTQKAKSSFGNESDHTRCSGVSKLNAKDHIILEPNQSRGIVTHGNLL